MTTARLAALLFERLCGRVHTSALWPHRMTPTPSLAALQVPDYHHWVKKPVCLKDIRQRLATAAYPGPEAFYAVRVCCWAPGAGRRPCAVRARRRRPVARPAARLGHTLKARRGIARKTSELSLQRRSVESTASPAGLLPHPAPPRPARPAPRRTWTSWCTTACCTTRWAAPCAAWGRSSSSVGWTTGDATRCSTNSRWGACWSRPPAPLPTPGRARARLAFGSSPGCVRLGVPAKSNSVSAGLPYATLCHGSEQRADQLRLSLCGVLQQQAQHLHATSRCRCRFRGSPSPRRGSLGPSRAAAAPLRVRSVRAAVCRGARRPRRRAPLPAVCRAPPA